MIMIFIKKLITFSQSFSRKLFYVKNDQKMCSAQVIKYYILSYFNIRVLIRVTLKG